MSFTRGNILMIPKSNLVNKTEEMGFALLCFSA